MVQLSPEFYQTLLQVSSSVGMKPEDILIVMASESGLNPSAKNRQYGAVGLIQFMPKTLKGLGFKGTPEEFQNVPDYEQLKYVERLIKSMSQYSGEPITSATQYYIGNFIPAALKIPGVRQKNPNTIICSKNPTQPHIPGVNIAQEASFYKANYGLDEDKDENITYGDIENHLGKIGSRKNYQVALNDLYTHTNYKPSTDKMVARKDDNVLTNLLNKFKQRGKEMPGNKSVDFKINTLLENYLRSVLAFEKDNKKLYKKYLPQNNAVIRISGPDYNSSIEFGRVLSMAIDEELLMDSTLHSNGESVELSVTMPGAKNISLISIQEISDSVSEAFSQATKKIGGINVKTELITNKTSSYHPVSLKISELQHRKFLLKFI